MADEVVLKAQKSQKYIDNLDTNIIRVITSNKNEMITLNQQQMLQSRDAIDNPLINKQTGSELLTPLYALKKNKPKPDLSDTKSFQDKMFFEMPNIKEFFINSSDFKSGKLVFDYGNIFGVAPSNQKKADEINTPDIINDYFKSLE